MSDALLLQTIPSYSVFQKWFKFFFTKKVKFSAILHPTGELCSLLRCSWTFLGIQLKLIPDYFYNNLLLMTANTVLEVVLP